MKPHPNPQPPVSPMPDPDLPPYLAKPRATGRTTRLLRHAIALEKAGHEVVVVADNTMDEHRLRLDLCRLGVDPHNTRIEVATAGRLGPSLDWLTMSVWGRPQAIVLADHHAIEDHFSVLLDMLHAYDQDAPAPEVPPTACSSSLQP